MKISKNVSLILILITILNCSAYSQEKKKFCNTILKEYNGIWRNKKYSVSICSRNNIYDDTIYPKYYENREKYINYTDIVDVIIENNSLKLKIKDFVNRAKISDKLITLRKEGNILKFEYDGIKHDLKFEKLEDIPPTIEEEIPKPVYNYPKSLVGIWRGSKYDVYTTFMELNFCNKDFVLKRFWYKYSNGEKNKIEYTYELIITSVNQYQKGKFDIFPIYYKNKETIKDYSFLFLEFHLATNELFERDDFRSKMFVFNEFEKCPVSTEKDKSKK